MDINKEKQREAAYWSRRFGILNQAAENFSRETYAEVEQAFNLAQKDIQRDIDAWMNRFAANNGISLVEAKKLLNAGELKEFKWDVAEYIKRGKENAVSGRWEKELENASARLHISRLEALQIQVQNHLETAFAVENKAVGKLVKDVYKSNYYHTAFEIQKGTGIGFDIAGIDEKKLDMIAKKPWTIDGKTFSDRIWERKDQMVNTLHQEMIRSCIYGRSRKEMTAALEQYVQKGVKNAKYCAARVVKTETCFYGSLSQKNSLDELGCDKYQIDMPIGKNSCEICREMNGKIFKTSEFEVGSTAPPFHPNCENASILPYYDDDFGMDGDPISEGLSYEDWEKKYVRKDENSGLTNAENSGIIDMGSERMNDRKISNVYTGIRNEIPLTDDERECVVKFLNALDVDMDKVIFTDVYRTAYNEKFDAYIIGTDIKPLENAKFGVINANQRISINGTVAHEVVGHREAHIKGQTQYDDVLEEVQASIRAARFAPELSIIERITLLMDARARLGRGRRLKDVRNLLYIDER